MSPNDLGEFSPVATVAENLTKLNIKDYVRWASRGLKGILTNSELEAEGVNIKLQTSKTGFGGERLWFSCPLCQRRVGVLYKHYSGSLGCRQCLGLKYRKSRFRGMVESGH